MQREVRPDEIGRSLRDISEGVALRLIRGGRPYGFWRREARELKAGDMIMEVKPTT